MFENSKNKINIWKEFANTINGNFTEGYSWNSHSTTIKYKNWEIIFDNFTLWSGKYSTEMTRIVAPIILKDNFRFEIYKEGFIRKIESFFEAQDVEIGYPNFDKAFTIKSNNELKIKTLLRNKQIRNLIESQKEINFKISDQKEVREKKLPENKFELSYLIDGEIHDLQNLKSLAELFKIVLDGLFQMNSIE